MAVTQESPSREAWQATRRRPVLYLIPGLLCDGSVWASQGDVLARRYQVRIPDLTQAPTIEAMAASVLADAPDRFSLAGHSMGARVAFEIMRQAGHRVERLAVLDTGVHPAQPGERERRQALVELARSDGMAALADRWLPPMVHHDRRTDTAFMERLRAMVMRMTPDIFARQVGALLARPDATPLLASIPCPTLVAVGRQDEWSPLAQHDPIAAAIPGARLLVFENSGHMAPVEAPDAVTAALLDWMSW